MLLSLTAVAAEDTQPASANTQPAAAPASASTAKPQEDVVPCPLPGEPATNCPGPHAPDESEAGLSVGIGGNVRPEAKPILVSSSNQNAYLLGLGQPLSPARQPAKPPLRDEK